MVCDITLDEALKDLLRASTSCWARCFGATAARAGPRFRAGKPMVIKDAGFVRTPPTARRTPPAVRATTCCRSRRSRRRTNWPTAAPSVRCSGRDQERPPKKAPAKKAAKRARPKAGGRVSASHYHHLGQWRMGPPSSDPLHDTSRVARPMIPTDGPPRGMTTSEFPFVARKSLQSRANSHTRSAVTSREGSREEDLASHGAADVRLSRSVNVMPRRATPVQRASSGWARCGRAVSTISPTSHTAASASTPR